LNSESLVFSLLQRPCKPTTVNPFIVHTLHTLFFHQLTQSVHSLVIPQLKMNEEGEFTTFLEHATVLSLIKQVCDPPLHPTVDKPTIVASVEKILSLYQEESRLLDAHLPTLVTLLCEQWRTPECMRLLYFLSKVRGAKTVVRLFPLVCLLK
jgi:hypothetical protein